VYRCSETFHKSCGFAKFCFQCSCWITSVGEWRSHCQSHIDKRQAPLRCNPIIFRNATACAGYCPVHLGRTDLPADERMLQYPDPSAWRRHISDCIAAYIRTRPDSAHLPCPHPECPVVTYSDEDLRRHLRDIHSVGEPQTKKRKLSPEGSQDDGIASSRPAKKQRTKLPAGRISTSVDNSEDPASLKFVNLSALRFKPSRTDLTGTPPAFSKSASPSTSEEDSLWDQQDDSSSIYTGLSSLEDDPVQLACPDGEDPGSRYLTLSEFTMADATDSFEPWSPDLVSPLHDSLLRNHFEERQSKDGPDVCQSETPEAAGAASVISTHAENSSFHGVWTDSLATAPPLASMGLVDPELQGDISPAGKHRSTAKKTRIIIKRNGRELMGTSNVASDSLGCGLAYRPSTLDDSLDLKGIAEMALSVNHSTSPPPSNQKEQPGKNPPVSTSTFSPGCVSGNAGEGYFSAWSNPSACTTAGLLDTAAACSNGFAAYHLALEDLEASETEVPPSVFDLGGEFGPDIQSLTDAVSEAPAGPGERAMGPFSNDRDAANPPALEQDRDYTADRLLDEWKGWFYVLWLDGSRSWQPRENILDDNLIKDLRAERRGLGSGVEVLRTRRIGGGKAEYRVHFAGRPSKEDEWVAEKHMSTGLIEKHQPSRKMKRGRRRS